MILNLSYGVQELEKVVHFLFNKAMNPEVVPSKAMVELGNVLPCLIYVVATTGKVVWTNPLLQTWYQWWILVHDGTSRWQGKFCLYPAQGQSGWTHATGCPFLPPDGLVWQPGIFFCPLRNGLSCPRKASDLLSRWFHSLSSIGTLVAYTWSVHHNFIHLAQRTNPNKPHHLSWATLHGTHLVFPPLLVTGHNGEDLPVSIKKNSMKVTAGWRYTRDSLVRRSLMVPPPAAFGYLQRKWKASQHQSYILVWHAYIRGKIRHSCTSLTPHGPNWCHAPGCQYKWQPTTTLTCSPGLQYNDQHFSDLVESFCGI